MDVRLPDGTVIQNVPDNITKAELVGKLQKSGMAVPAEWLDAKPKAQGMAGGVLAGVVQGLRDPVDAAAQMVFRAMPKGAQETLTAIDRKIGEVVPGFGPTEEVINRTNQEYEAARAAQGREGLDVARLGGNVAAALAIPGPKMLPAGATNLARAGRAAVQGGVGAAFNPVYGATDDADFLKRKAAQVALGAGAGGATSAVASKFAPTVANVVDQFRARMGRAAPGSPAAAAIAAREAGPQGVTSEAINRLSAAIEKMRNETGRDVALPAGVQADLQQQITKSLAKGQEVDAVALLRQRTAAPILGEAGLTVGQSTRDPMTYARELNLRGVEGVGEAMQQRMNQQQQKLISAIRGQGDMPDAYDAGGSIIKALSEFDKTKAADVSAAYRAFRESSGAQAPVPFGGVVSTVQSVIDDFGKENIPSAVLGRVNSYLNKAGTRQTKVFDIDEANKLLTQLNAHYDPAKPAQQAALGKIKSALRDAIDKAADEAPEGADLLKTAIGKARERFQLHEQIPALRDAAIQDISAKERVIRDYVMGGSVDQVGAMMKVLPSDAQAALRGALRRQILAEAAPGAEFGRETAALSQAALRRSIDKIGIRKLKTIMGADADKLMTIQQVAEWIMKEPTGATINRSNTAGQLANLMQKIPGVSIVAGPVNLVKESAQKFRDQSAIQTALKGEVPKSAATVSPNEVNAIRAYLENLALPVGVAAGTLPR